MNLLKWIFVTLFILIIIVPFAIYGYVQYQHNSLEKETYSYLIDKGYEGQEILSVESKLKKLSLFTAEVIFEDEPNVIRSEEHTSELQSRGHIVCRLLLEKKNKAK